MNPLLATARELEALWRDHGWSACLIGGIAVQRWGEPRVTRDVDLSLLTGFGNEEAFCLTLLGKYQPRVSDPIPFARKNRILLLETENGIGIDISLAALPVEERIIERASTFEFAPGLALRTCSAEDLIVLKLFASRPLDIRDAETVAIRNGPSLDWRLIEEELTPLAEAKEDPAILTHLHRIRQL